MFSTIFGSVSRAFRSNSVRDEEVAKARGLFHPVKRGRNPGYAVNVNLLFRALVDFGLIHPIKIGVSWSSVRCSSREVQVQLSLRILDVNGSPIEDKCCDLELIDWRVLGSSGEEEHMNLEGGCCERKERLWNLCSDGMAKLQVKVVRRCDAFVNLMDCLSDSVLVRAPGEHKGDWNEFLAYRFVHLLPTDYDYRSPEQLTVWETLLSFLYKQGCWALVSVDNGKGASCVAILRPFTDSLAFLYVLVDPLPQLAFDCSLVDDQFDMEDLQVVSFSYAAMGCNKLNKSNFFKSCMKSGTLSEKPKPNQICPLLEDGMVQRGFSGDCKLDYYVAKIIKSGYSHSLEDVVRKIYTKTYLRLFADEDEAPHYLPHSEDGDKSLNLKVYGNEMGENYVGNEPFSAGNEPFPLKKNDSGVFRRIIEGDHDKKLIEAKEERTERAHSFSSLTSWNPHNKQRVWDPKQKGMKPKTE